MGGCVPPVLFIGMTGPFNNSRLETCVLSEVKDLEDSSATFDSLPQNDRMVRY